MTAPRSVVDRIFRDPATGRLAIVQFPNFPLAIYLLATAARVALRPQGGAGAVLSLVSGAALLWWAVWEIGWGNSVFRRILGGLVLASLIASLIDSGVGR